MKKSIIILSFVLIPLLSFGQHMEVAVSYGTPSVYGVTESFLGAIGSAISGKESVSSSNGVINLGVKGYNNNKRWRYGGALDIETFSTEGAIKSNTYYSITPAIDYFWSSAEKKFRVYSGLTSGILLRQAKYIDEDNHTESTSDAFFAFNLTPVAFSYGTDFRVFLETNIGTRGFLQLGVSYAF